MKIVSQKKATLLTPRPLFSRFQGVMCGFEGNLIHTFNKSESAAANAAYFNGLGARRNVMLMGDSIGDLRMADGIADMAVCLKVGFLNAGVSAFEAFFCLGRF